MFQILKAEYFGRCIQYPENSYLIFQLKTQKPKFQKKVKKNHIFARLYYSILQIYEDDLMQMIWGRKRYSGTTDRKMKIFGPKVSSKNLKESISLQILTAL